jgi:hypothetical protein
MRSTGVWGALGGENLLICDPFAGLGLVRGMGRLVEFGAKATNAATVLRSCQRQELSRHHRQLQSSPAETARRHSRVSVIFDPRGAG